MDETLPESPPIVSGAFDYLKRLDKLEKLVMSLNDKVGAIKTKYNIMNNIVSDILHRIDNNEKTINDLNEFYKKSRYLLQKI